MFFQAAKEENINYFTARYIWTQFKKKNNLTMKKKNRVALNNNVTPIFHEK